ncbi:MAG: pyrimidine dimer DNA glycosylase/endonuclease V [Chloroflexota bacterium]
MRVWSVDPKRLDDRRLLGEHAEIHAVHAVITRRTRGYAAHPEVLRWHGHLSALVARHDRVAAEFATRGFDHRSPLRARGPVRAPRRLLSVAAELALLQQKGALIGGNPRP